MKRLGLLFIIFLTPFSVLSQSLEPIDVYIRCHLQLTGMIPVKTDATYKAVAAKTLAPEAGCQKIFELGRLAANGVMKNRTNATARRVVERMHQIHLNWFPQKYLPGNVGFTPMIVDTEEPALYLTRAAFLENEKFSSIVTLNSGLRGYRQPLVGESTSVMERKRYFNQPAVIRDAGIPTYQFRFAYYNWAPSTLTRNAVPTTIVPSDSSISQFGALQGVVPVTPISADNNFIATWSARYGSIRAKVKAYAQSAKIPFNGHFGGGILGSQGFVLTNTNVARAQVPSGEDIIHRRLAARIYETLLCHQLPTLTPNDVAGDIIKNSPHTFRRMSSCMACHSSMDPMAQTFRNLSISRSISGAASTDGMYGYFAETVYQTPLFRDPAHYSTQDPKGAFAYRTLLDKKKVTGNVNSIAQLGAHLATAPDLYLCAAKNYYKYFMGVDVQLVDREPTGTKKQLHQNNVINLAKKLQATQSVSEALKSLFATSQYQSRDFGGAEEEKK